VLVTDVSGYYEYIDTEVLSETLDSAGVANDVIAGLKGLLKGWHRKSGHAGIPQGPDASAVLANAYLIPVDELMGAEALARGWKYVRWSDDIRVFVGSEDEGRQAAYLLSVAMRRRGLYLSPKKTSVLTVEAYLERLDEGVLGDLAYLFDVKLFGLVRKAIWPLFRKITVRGTVLNPDRGTELRFCLYRMGKLRDDRALGFVLSRLAEMGFLARFAYLYLRAFLDREDVLEAIRETLAHLDSQRDAWLAGHLLRLLHEAPEVPSSALATIRAYSWRRGAPDAVRAVSLRALGRHGTSSDEADLRTRLWRESDHRVIRASLTALRDLSPSRSRATFGDFRRSNPQYTTVIDFLTRHGAPAPDVLA
jgi:hypothetical protein